MSDTNKLVRTLIGRVVSDKRTATRTVEVQWAKRHPRYGKVVRRTTKFHVHDPKHECKTGDVVEIKQIRPISKTKTWALEKVLESAN